MTTTRRPRRAFSAEFKRQMVDLYEAGKPFTDIVREYDLTTSSLRRWVTQSRNSGSFKEADNRTPEQSELIALRKENRQLKMENDILKQAALIFAQK